MISNRIPIKLFRLNSKLGEGTFSTIWDATLSKNSSYLKNLEINNFALKITKSKLNDLNDCKKYSMLKNESNLLKKLNHENIIKFYGEIENNDNKLYGLCLQKGNKNDLFSIIEKEEIMDNLVTKYYFYKLIKSIEYCHNNQIIHGDIKLENIIFDKNYNLILSDFGLSIDLNNLRRDKFNIGTLKYMAPEIFDYKYTYYDYKINLKKTDIWSSGVVLFILSTGLIPWRSTKRFDKSFRFYQNNKKEYWKYFKEKSSISLENIDLLDKIFEIDPNKRISINEILNHPFCSLENMMSSDEVKQYMKIKGY